MVDSAYFKTLLHGTQSKFGEGKADPLQSDLSQQAAILERAIARAKDFGTDKVRIFSFLRVADPDTVSRENWKERPGSPGAKVFAWSSRMGQNKRNSTYFRGSKGS